MTDMSHDQNSASMCMQVNLGGQLINLTTTKKPTLYAHQVVPKYLKFSLHILSQVSRVPMDFQRKKYRIIGQLFVGIKDILAQLQDIIDSVFVIFIHIIDQFHRQEYILFFRKSQYILCTMSDAGIAAKRRKFWHPRMSSDRLEYKIL